MDLVWCPYERTAELLLPTDLSISLFERSFGKLHRAFHEKVVQDFLVKCSAEFSDEHFSKKLLSALP